MKYAYKARRSDGTIVSNEIEAVDKFSLLEETKREGLSIISITEIKKSSLNLDKYLIFLTRVTAHDKILFMHNLAAMISAGVALSRAITILEKQTTNQKFKKIISEIGASITKGKGFSDSLKEYPKIFPSIVVSMVRAGEESGKLSETLNQIAINLEKSYLLAKKVRGALIYPAVILTAIVIVAILMFIFVVPSLTATFKDLNLELPTATKVIIGISDFMSAHTLTFLGLIVVGISLLVYFLKTKLGKKVFDFLVIRIPLIGNMIKEMQSARTARTLSSLFSSGVDVGQAINITKEVVQNFYYRQVLEAAAAGVVKGAPLSSFFKEANHLYPVMVGEMMEVGEETGKIGEMLSDIALFYESEVEQKTKDMSTVIEPFLMIVVGVSVGFFALAMISPIYSLVGAI